MKAVSNFGFLVSRAALLLGLLVGTVQAEAATTYFSADAENGVISPPWGGSIAGQVTNTTVRAHSGTRSYYYVEPNPGTDPSNGSKTLVFPAADRASDPGGAYFSAWYWLDQGFEVNNNWFRNNFQWKVDNSDAACTLAEVKSIIGFDTALSRTYVA